MTSADTEAVTALQELLDERQRYEGWLNVLDERRSSTPPHVYSRVHTDYSLRLERVTERLAERAGQLSATIDALTARLNALRTRESERTDSRHEAELRAAVGEYGPEEWERLRAAADRELGEIGDQRRGIESELAELERVLALTHHASETADVSSAAEQIAPAPAPAEESATPPAESEPSNADAVDMSGGGSGRGSDVDAPSINNFVAEWPAKQTSGAPSSAASESAPQGDGVPEVPEVDGGAAPVAAHVLQGVTAATRPAPPPANDSRRESEKTLKCPECGVMNYATEWYCERCGGELSSF